MSKAMYLSPEFLISMAKSCRIGLPQLRQQFRRSNGARLALVDAFSKGYDGDLDELLARVAKDYNAVVGPLGDFVDHLRSTGSLGDSKPKNTYTGQPASGAGQIPAGEIKIAAPVTLVAQSGEYLWFDHRGHIILRLSLPEVQAAVLLGKPRTVESAWAAYNEEAQHNALDRTAFDALIARMAGAGVLLPKDDGDDVVERPLFGAVNRRDVQSLVDARVKAHDEKMAALGKNLVQVVPVNTQQGTAPVSLGMVIAYAMEFEDKRLQERYDFVPMFFTDEDRLVERAYAPGIFLFSNYVWNVEINLRMSAAVKAANPDCITVHGGPSTPKYEGDSEEFFATHDHIDVTVRGEGELTLAELLAALDLDKGRNLDDLREVAGLSYRTPTGVQRTADRERIEDINTIPSPFLMGLFDDFGSVRAAAVIESNRGCPYGCTFCDWGSATLSRVRKFDLDRVYAELEWCATHGIKEASIADANFGMLERDVDITRKIAELRKIHGYPGTVNINYAKNQVRYLRQIIEIMSNANILAEGVVSLQSTDEQTLKVIDRSNIKLDKYNELTTEFRHAKLPLSADIMMGLPGSTPESFRTDLQRCTDRDVRARANPTQLLPNSPMNDPEYRKKHGIVARPGDWVKETATFTRQQWEEMNELRMIYYLLESYGLLRYIARFARRETGLGEVSFYDRIRSDVLSDSATYPVVNNAFKVLESYMAPPGSWALFMDEIRRFLINGLGLADDSALRTAITVQLAHIPSPGRVFPESIPLEHDFASWQEVLFNTREEGHRDDWEQHIPRLSDFGPATLVVDDPNEICRRDVGHSKYAMDMNLRTWELDSPVARPRLKTATAS